MKVQPNKWYMVASKIVVRGTPRYEAIVIRGGHLVKETKARLIFCGFEANKKNIVQIKEASEECESVVEMYNELLK